MTYIGETVVLRWRLPLYQTVSSTPDTKKTITNFSPGIARINLLRVHFKTLLSHAGASGEQTAFGKYFSVCTVRASAPDKPREVLKCALRRESVLGSKSFPTVHPSGNYVRHDLAE